MYSYKISLKLNVLDSHVDMNDFLKNVQDRMNSKLEKFGIVTVNMVLEELGIPLSEDGKICGWVSNDSRKDKIKFDVEVDRYNPILEVTIYSRSLVNAPGLTSYLNTLVNQIDFRGSHTKEDDFVD